MTLRGTFMHLQAPPTPEAPPGLVFLPNASTPVTIGCVVLYASLAAIAALRARSLRPPPRSSPDNARVGYNFQWLLAAFAMVRALSFVGRAAARDLLNRTALCLFFSLVLFQVLFWVDIANPKVSLRSRWIWKAFVLSNLVFYALVLGLALLQLWLHDKNHPESTDWEGEEEISTSTVFTGIVPVLLISLGSFISALGLLMTTCKTRRRVGRVLKQSQSFAATVPEMIQNRRRPMNEHMAAKLQRALQLTIFVMIVCSIVFFLRAVLYLQRPFSHRGCGDLEDPDVCVVVGYAIPEVLPCVLFLILMWQIDPGFSALSEQQSSARMQAVETTPLLEIQQAQNNSWSLFTHYTKEKKVVKKQSTPLSKGLGQNVLQRAKRRLGAFKRRMSSSSTMNRDLERYQSSSDAADLSASLPDMNVEREMENFASSAPEDTQLPPAVPNSPISSDIASAWFSFHCFSLQLPTVFSPSFLVLYRQNDSLADPLTELGRTEVSTDRDPSFHLLLAVEARPQDLLRASIYSVRNFQTLSDVRTQWLVGFCDLELSSYMSNDCFELGKATVHSLASPLTRSNSSGEIVVRCEAMVKKAGKGIRDDGKQRVTRAFTYLSQEEDASQEGQNKMLVEEELVESAFTWEVPYQLLQLVLHSLVEQLDRLKEENGGSNDEDEEEEVHKLQASPSMDVEMVGSVESDTGGDASSVQMQETTDDFDLTRPRNASSIGILSELIHQIQDDALERKKRKWRLELIAKTEKYIAEVEDAIVRYGNSLQCDLSFKPSTMKADSALKFLPLNLHQHLMTVGTAVPTSKHDVSSKGSRYKKMLSQVPSMSPSESADSDVMEVTNEIDDTFLDLDNTNTSMEQVEQTQMQPHEALRQRVISFESAQNLVEQERAQRQEVPTEQRKLAETIVALGMSEKDLTHVDASESGDSSPSDKEGQFAVDEGDDIANYPHNGGWSRRSRSQKPTSTPFQHFRMYATTTVGAFAAHAYGFRQGGVRQLKDKLEQLRETLAQEAERPRSDLTMEALERQVNELRWHIDRRMEVVFCQALGALVTCVQQTLFVQLHNFIGDGSSKTDMDLNYLEMISSIGFLFSVESLLSTYRNEAGMLGDMDAAVKQLARISIRLKPVYNPDDAAYRVLIESDSSRGVVVNVPVIIADASSHIDRTMHRIPGQDAPTAAVYLSLSSPEHKERAKKLFKQYIQVVPVLFSQGINEMQTVANTVGRNALQRDINSESVVLLEEYSNRFAIWCDEHETTLHRRLGQETELETAMYDKENRTLIKQLLARLHVNVHESGRSKRMAILSLSSSIARCMGGGRVTCCKSAKDRTAMSITLEEANLLVRLHNLPPQRAPALVAVMRTSGVRIENAFKNIGKRQFAFNMLQRSLLPEEYRCPDQVGGTGNES